MQFYAETHGYKMSAPEIPVALLAKEVPIEVPSASSVPAPSPGLIQRMLESNPYFTAVRRSALSMRLPYE